MDATVTLVVSPVIFMFPLGLFRDRGTSVCQSSSRPVTVSSTGRPWNHDTIPSKDHEILLHPYLPVSSGSVVD